MKLTIILLGSLALLSVQPQRALGQKGRVVAADSVNAQLRIKAKRKGTPVTIAGQAKTVPQPEQLGALQNARRPAADSGQSLLNRKPAPPMPPRQIQNTKKKKTQ